MINVNISGFTFCIHDCNHYGSTIVEIPLRYITIFGFQQFNREHYVNLTFDKLAMVALSK